MGRSSFGNVRRRTSGRWQTRYFVEGTWHTGPNTFATKADASAWLAREQADRSRGTWVDPRAGKETVESYATRWLAGRSDLRPTTRAKYEGLLCRHILPTLGRFELAQLKPGDVRSWYYRLADRAPSTADDAYRALRAIVGTAVADGELVKSPCTVRGAGGIKAAERPVASIAEVAAAVDAAPERYRLAFLLAAWCQLRRGEVLGLQRKDVDLQHGTLRVQRARVQTAAGEAHTGPPKTDAGRGALRYPRTCCRR